MAIWSRWGLVGFCLWGIVVGARASESSTVIARSRFSTDDEGWRLQGKAAGPTHQSSGGNPGGFIFAVDPAGTVATSYWVAPEPFLGDVRGSFMGSLSFDIRVSGKGPLFRDADVVLEGAGLRLTYRHDRRPRVDRWTHVSVRLDGRAGWRNSATGNRPSAANMKAVLKNLEVLLIRGEFREGPEVFQLDNVVLKRRGPG